MYPDHGRSSRKARGVPGSRVLTCAYGRLGERPMVPSFLPPVTPSGPAVMVLLNGGETTMPTSPHPHSPCTLALVNQQPGHARDMALDTGVLHGHLPALMEPPPPYCLLKVLGKQCGIQLWDPPPLGPCANPPPPCLHALLSQFLAPSSDSASAPHTGVEPQHGGGSEVD